MLSSYLAGLEGAIFPALAIFVASFLQAITGFGLVIVAAPLLMLFYEPKLTVPIMLLLACCGNFVQGLASIRRANLPLIGVLYLGVLVGQPIGFLAFDWADNQALSLFITVVILVSLLSMQLTHRHIAERPRNSFLTGILSGFTSITAGMAGPPFLIYLAYTTMTVDVFRATCFVFFFLCNLTSLTSYTLGGLSLDAALAEFVYLLPALAVGLSAGHLVSRFVPGALVRRIIFFLLYAACIYNIVRTLL